MAATHRGE